jgi:REP element-mobilizing transposase RayT
MNALKYFDGKRYNLYAWCVMPNHVHVLFRPYKGEILEKILHSWKSFTSKEAMKILRKAGETPALRSAGVSPAPLEKKKKNGENDSDVFWQREYYDHRVREDGEFQRIQEYILNNPAAAGLENWKWVGYGDRYAIMPEDGE